MIPNLLDSHDLGLGPKIGRTAYAILGPSATGFSKQRIEQELLHSIINPLTEGFDPIKRSHLREYIIRAVVLRLNCNDKRCYNLSREKLVQRGYTDIGYFLDKLMDFESSAQPFNLYLREWLKDIRFD